MSSSPGATPRAFPLRARTRGHGQIDPCVRQPPPSGVKISGAYRFRENTELLHLRWAQTGSLKRGLVWFLGSASHPSHQHKQRARCPQLTRRRRRIRTHFVRDEWIHDIVGAGVAHALPAAVGGVHRGGCKDFGAGTSVSFFPIFRTSTLLGRRRKCVRTAGVCTQTQFHDRDLGMLSFLYPPTDVIVLYFAPSLPRGHCQGMTL